MTRVVYDPGYNISFLGLEKLHPFDSRKYGRAWQCLRERLGDALDAHWIKPAGPVSAADLERVDSGEYLQQLRHPRTVAAALEIGAVAAVPHPVVDRCVLRPMRWATAATDIFADDPLGALAVSAEAILERDLFTICELRKRGIPTVMVLSGGYTRQSYRLVADTVARLLTSLTGSAMRNQIDHGKESHLEG